MVKMQLGNHSHSQNSTEKEKNKSVENFNLSKYVIE